MRKFTFVLLLILIIPGISFAQIYFGSPIAASDGGSITATAKNWEAIEVNPANLGWSSNHSFSLSIMNVGVNLQDNGMTLSELQHANFRSSSIDSTQRQQMYQAATANGGLNLSATVNWFAFSFKIPKIGGFAISLTDKAYAHGQVSQNAAKLITDLIGVQDTAELIAVAKKDSNLLKQTPAQLLDGTNVGGYHYRELNIDFGRKLLTIPVHSRGTGGASFENSEFADTSKSGYWVNNPIEIYGGIGFKPIWGQSDYTAVVQNGENIEEGTYDYTSADVNDPLHNLFSANGRGFGVDLGLSATYKKWAVSVSAIDLGKINWQNNSFQPVTISLPPQDSISDLFQNNAKIFNRFIDHTPGGANYSTQLPSQFRSGISYQVGKLLTLSSDFVAPLNTVQGNLINPYYSVGAHVDLFRIIGFGVGFATEKGYGNLVPVGVFINILFGVEIYAGTNDALAYLATGTGHVLSGSAGIKIFGF